MPRFSFSRPAGPSASSPRQTAPRSAPAAAGPARTGKISSHEPVRDTGPLLLQMTEPALESWSWQRSGAGTRVARTGGAADVAGRPAPGYCHLLNPLGARAPDGRGGRDPPDQERLGQLAEEQAALRRVATLVAQATPPEKVFAAVGEEVGMLLPVDLASLCRYEPDRTGTSVAAWGTAAARFPVGSRWPLEGYNLGTLVFETGRPVRIDRYGDSSSG